MKRIIFLLICFVLASCRSLDERNEECIDNMPFEVRMHVHSFLRHSLNYGVKLNLKKLRIELTGELGDRAGFYRHGEHIIILDTTSVDWSISPEALIYHELGHAVLKRGHNNNLMDGLPLSYMNERKYRPVNKWHKQIMIKELFTVEI